MEIWRRNFVGGFRYSETSKKHLYQKLFAHCMGVIINTSVH